MSSHHTEKSDPRQLRAKRIRTLSTRGDSSDEYSGKFLVYKQRGETLASLIKRFRSSKELSLDIPITYAGRLDPMAEGIVLLLVGGERYNKDALLGLAKTYEIEVLFGITTDTDDPLGLVTHEKYQIVDEGLIAGALSRAPKLTELPYPAYSSAIVEGKPLFVHAREGSAVSIPMKKITITEAKLLHMRTVPLEMIAREAIDDIGRVEGDFRQLAIMKGWRSRIETHHDTLVTIATIRISASSGTYMRSIARWIGEQLGVPALAYKIKRTKLGEWTL